MPIGSSPFLTADVDEAPSFGGNRSVLRLSDPNDIVSARLELIRRRVLSGYYAAPGMATEVARRLLDRALNEEHE